MGHIHCTPLLHDGNGTCSHDSEKPLQHGQGVLHYGLVCSLLQPWEALDASAQSVLCLVTSVVVEWELRVSTVGSRALTPLAHGQQQRESEARATAESAVRTSTPESRNVCRAKFPHDDRGKPPLVSVGLFWTRSFSGGFLPSKE